MVDWWTAWALLPSSFTNVSFSISLHTPPQSAHSGWYLAEKSSRWVNTDNSKSCLQSWVLTPLHPGCPTSFGSLGMLSSTQLAEHTLLAAIQKAATQKFQPLGLIFAAKKDSSCWSLVHIAGHPKSSSILHNMERICSAKVMPVRSMGVDKIPFASHGWSASLYKLHI